MSFNSVYNVHGINTEDFFYSGIATNSNPLDYGQVFDVNSALHSAKVNARIGPAYDPQMRLPSIFNKDKFAIGVYIPLTEFDKLEHDYPTKMINLTDALGELEKKIFDVSSVKKH